MDRSVYSQVSAKQPCIGQIVHPHASMVCFVRPLLSRVNGLAMSLLGTLQHPGVWYKRNGGGQHSGLEALAGRSENSETVRCLIQTIGS